MKNSNRTGRGGNFSFQNRQESAKVGSSLRVGGYSSLSYWGSFRPGARVVMISAYCSSVLISPAVHYAILFYNMDNEWLKTAIRLANWVKSKKPRKYYMGW